MVIAPRRPVPWLAASLFALLAAVPGFAAEYEAEKKRYKAYQERPSLWMRHRGRQRFAKTRDTRALKILGKTYAKPEVPKDQVRYLIATLCADHFQAPPHVPLLQALRKKHAKTRDAWLWYRTLGVDLKNDGAGGLLDVARTQRDPFLRLAAVEALASAKHADVLPLLAEMLGDLPARPLDRALIVESAAHALYLLRTQRREDPWKALADAVIHTLDDPKTRARTKLVVARRLRRIFGVRELHKTSEPWVALAKKPPGKVRVVRGTVQPSRREDRSTEFVGLDATGSRIAYVIDMSDSMLTPLTGKEIEDLKRPPTTSPTKPKKRAPVTGGKAPPAEPPEEPEPDPDPPQPEPPDLPWARIHTRFDVARELLKLSLRALGPDTSFCVIYFGSEAGLLAATPGLRRAQPALVEKVARELDAIEPGPVKKDRPHGTLRGYTNFHGGLHRAFKVRERGFLKTDEYVDATAFEDGADTIFVFSDGRPSWDDWPEWDDLEAQDEQGDPESRTTTEKKKRAHFYGPYAVKSAILDDARRLNLFRKAEIHCVGIGEYDSHLLDMLRRTGLGGLRQIPRR